MILSVKTNLSFRIEYFKIQLSFPPDAYKNFSSELNLRPSHDLATTIVSRTFSFFESIRYNACVLWPLQVTARYFFEDETAIFNGRSPTGKLRPAGVSDHPFGNMIRFRVNSSVDFCG